MKTFVAASAALVASVAASQHRAGHPAFHNRHFTQELCTKYSTVYVTASQLPPPVANSTAYAVPTTSCTKGEGEASSTIIIPEVSSTAVPTPYVPAYSEPAAPVTKEAYTPPAPGYTPPAYTLPSAPVVSSKAAEPSKPSNPGKPEKPSKPSKPSHGGGSYGQTGRIVTKGDKWAITYTPYTAHGDCKSAGEVQGDIAKIAGLGFSTIRVYSTDCGVFDNVVPACQSHGIKIIFGVFLSAGKGPFSSAAEDQVQALIKNAPKDSIAMVIVGNESLFNGCSSPEELASYIDHVRTQFLNAGFPQDIAFTTTEPVDVWQNKGAALCDHIDVFAVQIHPFFTSKISASEAGDFAAEQLAMAAAVCPEAAARGKYITEIGWPTQGNSNGNAVPGQSQQKEALKSILAKVGTESCVFSFQNDFWKSPGAFGVEQYWGIADSL